MCFHAKKTAAPLLRKEGGKEEMKRHFYVWGRKGKERPSNFVEKKRKKTTRKRDAGEEKRKEEESFSPT